MACNEKFQKISSVYQENLLDFAVADLPDAQVALRTYCSQALKQVPPVVDALTRPTALLIWGGHARGTSIDNHDIDLLSLWTSLPGTMIIGRNGINQQKSWESDGHTYDLTTKETSNVLGSILKGSINSVEIVFLPRWCYFQIDEPLRQIFQKIQATPLRYIEPMGVLNSAFGFAYDCQKALTQKEVSDHTYFKKISLAYFYLQLALNIGAQKAEPYEQISRPEIIRIKKGGFSRAAAFTKLSRAQEKIQAMMESLPDRKENLTQVPQEELILEFAQYQLTKYNEILNA